MRGDENEGILDNKDYSSMRIIQKILTNADAQCKLMGVRQINHGPY